MSRAFLAVWSVGVVGVVISFLKPPKSAHSLSHRTLRVGPLEELPIGQARLIPSAQEPIWVVRVDEENLVALDGVCTHVRCVLAFDSETRTLDCPCHRGAFDLNGNVLAGPPRRPLQRHRVETQLGQVYVRL